jgi:DNA invertase Pin-like site-specific DNA recombinase
MPLAQTAKRRVAGYARVSTDSKEQITSYKTQVDYYTRYIQEQPDWKFVGVYTDEGISAVNTKKRDGFNQMVRDALIGKIDLIVTKSVSRFARNTVDSLVTVRKLKEKGVEVYFEKENIYTLDSKGELLITIMSSLAQEESRSISENVTWGQRKRFADGKISVAYKQFLGYEKGEDDMPRIVEKEALIVQRIYALFMAGKTPCGVARLLTEEGIPTPAGKALWRASTVESILTNEKYKGAALLQKKFTVDFLLKKMKTNEGEVPQYYIDKSHEPIIDPVEFELVQAEFARRKGIGYRYSGNSIWSSRIVCGDCGAYFGAKVWDSTSKYRRTIWQCNAKFQNDRRCSTPHLDEEEIKARFVTAYNILAADKTQLLDDCRIMQTVLSDCSGLDAEIPALQEEMDVVAGLIRKCVEENSRDAQSQSEYGARYNGYVERYEAVQNKLEDLQREHALRQAKAGTIGAFMFAISEQDALTDFDEKLWTATICSVTVHSDGRMAFHFLTGDDIEA